MTMNTGDLGVVLITALVVILVLGLKILNNKRQVVRTTLHGTVTYTLKGYNGPEATRILDSIGRTEEVSLTKATAEDVR